MSVSPEQQLRAYVDYLRDLGVYDLYRRDDPATPLPDSLRAALAPCPAATPSAVPALAAPTRPQAAPQRPAQPPPPRPASPAPPSYFSLDAEPALPPELTAAMPTPKSFDELVPLPAAILAADARPAALDAVRAEIGDCTRCPLAYAGRRNIVFGDGSPTARLMFIGEGPGADEDEQGIPFVGKSGQLLDNMIAAMGLARDGVYIANIVKCRTPANRPPEFAEAGTCSPFLIRQIDIVRPEVIVALGLTAARYLLGTKQPLGSLRGQWHTARGAKVAVTFHPAFLLRDPRQKGEAWKDLQRVMAELGLQPPVRAQ